MNRRNLIILGLIILLTGLGLAEVLVKSAPSIQDVGPGNNTLGMRLGLDLSGGTHLVYEADLSQIGNESAEEAMQGVIDIISMRVDAYGVTEPLIQKQGADRVSIQLPGIRDMETAVELVGQTAQLDFRELVYDSEGNPVIDETGDYQWKPAKGIDSQGNEVHLTGKYLKRNNYVVLDQTTNEPQVAFEFNGEGATLFEQITTRLLEKPLGIFLDDQLISSPTVKAVLSDNGVITGLSLDEARNLAILLNAGALPVPLKGPIVREDIDPTLGADSLRKSLVAGMVGIILIILFMLLYYRVPGVLASVALIIYGILVLAAFKLIPVTLTLSGIAAFILSIGMAVDANVLIFERLKEELRAGKPLSGAIEAGFNRAWSAIRDSNFTTIIVCIILYWMGNMLAEPRVMGFALTLGIGVLLSMFTAIVVTRTFLRLLVGTGIANNLWLFGAKKAEQTSLPKERQ
ncbi:MAG: protein translocase subunit SecD [Chloroflexi bacterium]|nr:protein translocase subunit SecD [Chloroflexota bacterium]